MIRIAVRTERARRIVQGLIRRLTPEATSPLIEKVAWSTHRRLVEDTPKKWTGQTRRGWRVMKNGNGWRVTNENKVMLWLELGTRDHGPKTKKALFIPLKSSALAGWNASLVMGVDYILTRRVKGIRARYIVRKERPIAQNHMKMAIDAYVAKVVKEAAQ